MKNKLMSMWDKMLLRKRYIIETINDLLKNGVQRLDLYECVARGCEIFICFAE